MIKSNSSVNSYLAKVLWLPWENYFSLGISGRLNLTTDAG